MRFANDPVSETLAKAEYFERRAKKARFDSERERYKAAALRYRTLAKAATARPGAAPEKEDRPAMR